MAQKEVYEKKTEELLTPIAEANNVRVYDVEFVKEGSEYYLRAYIDKDGGVTIDDCENVSRAMSDVLDREDYIQEGYIFEVSSPGLGRTLKKDRHLDYSMGEEVEIKLYKPIDGSKDYSGILKSYDPDTITISLGDGEETMQFVRKDIAVIRLALDF